MWRRRMEVWALCFFFFPPGVRLKLLEEAELPLASMTGGLVQEFEHSVLPSMTPAVTLVCTLLSILVSRAGRWDPELNPIVFTCGCGHALTPDLLLFSEAGGSIHLAPPSRCSGLPTLPAALRSGLLHVWLACPREGHPHRHPSPQVSADPSCHMMMSSADGAVWTISPCFSSRSILAVENREDAGIFLILTTTGHYSLFPLLFTPAGKQEVV